MLKKYIITGLLVVSSFNIYTTDKSTDLFVRDMSGETYTITVKPGYTTNAEFINLVAKAHKDSPDHDRTHILIEGKILPINQDLLDVNELKRFACLRCVVSRMSRTRLAWLDVTTRHNRDAHTTTGTYFPASTTIAPDIFKITASAASKKISYSADLD